MDTTPKAINQRIELNSNIFVIMSACNVEVIKLIGKYYNVPVGTVCYNTDKVLTTVLDKQNVEGFASIILRLATKTVPKLSQEQSLLCYQWLEYIAMYANQAACNLTFAKAFLEDINRALERNSYLTGQFLTVADISAYYVLYPILERLSVLERESYIAVCRWSKHIQAQPKTSDAAKISSLFPLPKQIYPHELKNMSLDKPVLYHPQPFSFPGYPVILYL